jgi:hypothetical protein
MFSLKVLVNPQETNETQWILPFAVAKGNEKSENIRFLMQSLSLSPLYFQKLMDTQLLLMKLNK